MQYTSIWNITIIVTWFCFYLYTMITKTITSFFKEPFQSKMCASKKQTQTSTQQWMLENLTSYVRKSHLADAHINLRVYREIPERRQEEMTEHGQHDWNFVIELHVTATSCHCFTPPFRRENTFCILSAWAHHTLILDSISFSNDTPGL